MVSSPYISHFLSLLLLNACFFLVNINGQDIATLSPSERFSVTRPIVSSPSFERTVLNPEVDFTITQERSEEAMLCAFLGKRDITFGFNLLY